MSYQIHIQKGWNVFVYYGLKRLDFNKGLNVLGYLGVENNENKSWVDMSSIFHVMGWSVNGLKRVATHPPFQSMPIVLKPDTVYPGDIADPDMPGYLHHTVGGCGRMLGLPAFGLSLARVNNYTWLTSALFVLTWTMYHFPVPPGRDSNQFTCWLKPTLQYSTFV